MDRADAWRVIETHLPARKRFGRRLRCACGDPYPCRTRWAALEELAGRWNRLWS